MKRITTFLILFVFTFSFAQEYEVTKEGLRDSNNLEKDFLVLNIKDKTANQLYGQALKYVNTKYSSPDDAIKAKTENEYLRFNTFISNFMRVKNGGAKIPVDASYTIELRFKDGKVKHNVINIDLGGVTWKGSIWKGYPIWNKKDKLRLPETKVFIEAYFNTEVEELIKYLSNNSEDEDW